MSIIRNKFNKSQIFNLVVVIISFFLLAFFYYCVPMTIDDYFWGSDSGITQLKSFFYDYNGRYLGNLLVIILTRYKIFRILIMPIILIALCHQISVFVAKKFNVYYYCASLSIFFFLAFLPKISIFSQTIAWTSGFSNYVAVSLLLVIYTNLVKKDLIYYKAQCSVIHCVLAFILGFSSCLFLENITLTCLFIGFIINLFLIFKKKQLCYRQIWCLIGTILGTTLMFTNSSYIKMFFGNYNDGRESGFRSFGFLSFDLLQNIPLLVFFFIIVSIICCIPIFVTNNQKERIELYSILCIVVIMTFPLLFTNGGTIKYFTAFRIYFPQISFSIMFFLRCIECFKNRYCFSRIKVIRALGFFQVLLFIVLCSCVISIYYRIHCIECTMENNIALQLQSNETTIEIIEFPDKYSKYIHEINSFKNGWEKEFKSFYSIDPDLRLDYIPYEDYS